MKVEEFMPDDLDVQKAVVESLAADKVEQNETIKKLKEENICLRNQYEQAKDKIAEMKVALEKVGDLLAKNSESEISTKISLLERDLELADRFEGETRDHVLEVIKEARDTAEKDGRLRRAQILESVLIANEPVGNLIKNRINLKKLFCDNGNILTGVVIEELQKRGISHKNGDNYLLPDEIIKRIY